MELKTHDMSLELSLHFYDGHNCIYFFSHLKKI